MINVPVLKQLDIEWCTYKCYGTLSTTVLFGFIYFSTDKSSEAESTQLYGHIMTQPGLYALLTAAMALNQYRSQRVVFFRLTVPICVPRLWEGM